MPTSWEIRKGKALVTVTARLLRLTIKEQRRKELAANKKQA
jgi:hypothetical protein